MVIPRASAASIIAASILLVSCSFVGKDMFPDSLGYLAATRDIDDDFSDAGLSDPVQVRRIETLRASGSGRKLIFVYALSYEGGRLFAYDTDSLSLKAVYDDSTLTPFLAVAPTGNFLCGGVEIDAESLAVVSDSRPTSACWDSVRALYSDSILYVLSQSDSGLSCTAYDSSWTAADLGTTAVSSSASSSYLEDAYCEDAVSPIVRLLANTGGSLSAIEFSQAAFMVQAFATGASLDRAAYSAVSLPSSGDSGGAWLTRDGAVLISYGNETSFTRYSCSSGDEKDSWTLDESDGDRSYHFDQSGRRWIEYDEENGRLRLMRSWW